MSFCAGFMVFNNLTGKPMKSENSSDRALRVLSLVTAGIFSLSRMNSGLAAEGESYPRVSGEIAIEIQNDWTYDSDDRDAELNDLFTTTEPVLVAHFTPNLLVFVHGVLEPVLGPDPSDDRFFEDHGLFVEDLYLQFEYEPFTIRGGKITPNFGLAWNLAPGVYGTDFAEGTYEFSERIGFGGDITCRDETLGEHVFSASVFFLDTSILAKSVFNRRDDVEFSDGGVSNTEDPSSFALGLDGAIPALPNFEYHVAGIHQEGGRGDSADENGFVVGGVYAKTVGEVEVLPFVEYVYFDNADGVDGADRHLLTTSLQLVWKNWNLALSRTSRNTDVAGASDADDELNQISIGYEFEFGLAVDVGWRIAEEDDIDSEILGILFAYNLSF